MPIARHAPRPCFLHRTCSNFASHPSLSHKAPPSTKRAQASTQTQCRPFSSTPSRRIQTQQRNKMWAWLNGPGAKLRQPRADGTNYLGAYDRSGRLVRDSARQEASRGAEDTAESAKDLDDPESEAAPSASRKQASQPSTPQETEEDLRPFPLNPYFRSQPVLSEEFREEIWKRVQQQNSTIKEVSQSLRVDMSRVAAVVRMKEIEKRWVKEGKKLVRPYARAVSTMLPQTPYTPGQPDSAQPVHEAINMLPVHKATKNQLFLPTPESQHFTRADAGRAFRRGLLPAEARIPHPDQVLAVRAREQRRGGEVVSDEYVEGWTKDLKKETDKLAAARAKEEQRRRDTVSVSGARWDFRMESFDGTSVKRSPRDAGVGWRYGVPLDDRKKGKVKIPTEVDV